MLIFRLVNALMARWISGVGQGIYIFWIFRTYLHSGIAAARALTPDMSLPSPVRLLLLISRLVVALVALLMNVIATRM